MFIVILQRHEANEIAQRGIRRSSL